MENGKRRNLVPSMWYGFCADNSLNRSLRNEKKSERGTSNAAGTDTDFSCARDHWSSEQFVFSSSSLATTIGTRIQLLRFMNPNVHTSQKDRTRLQELANSSNSFFVFTCNRFQASKLAVLITNDHNRSGSDRGITSFRTYASFDRIFRFNSICILYDTRTRVV